MRFLRVERAYMGAAVLVALVGLMAGLPLVAQAQSQATPLGSGSATAAPLTAIPKLDLPRYLGVWHEWAKFPNVFQRNCASNTTATYATLPSGEISVVNRCVQADGKPLVAEGRARIPNPAANAQLQVRFAPDWLALFPFVWANYWVIDLDDNYQLAAVSEPTLEYLWVLSRSPQINPSAYQALLERLRQKGFNTERLVVSAGGN